MTQARCSNEQAKVAYRRLLSELREELKEAKELGKVERAEQTEQEIDALTREPLARRRTRRTQSAGDISFGTSPAERRQDDQVGTGKNRAERCHVGRLLLALHQDGHLLLLRA